MQSLQELCKLEDTLNLTGQIAAVGCYPRKTGGFSDVYEGHYRGKKVAVKVIREFGSDIATLTKVRRRICTPVHLLSSVLNESFALLFRGWLGRRVIGTNCTTGTCYSS